MQSWDESRLITIMSKHIHFVVVVKVLNLQKIRNIFIVSSKWDHYLYGKILRLNFYEWKHKSFF